MKLSFQLYQNFRVLKKKKLLWFHGHVTFQQLEKKLSDHLIYFRPSRITIKNLQYQLEQLLIKILDGQTTCTVYIYFVTPEFINNWFFSFIFFVILRNFHILVYNSTLHNRQYAHLFLLVSCQSSTVASYLNKLFC